MVLFAAVTEGFTGHRRLYSQDMPRSHNANLTGDRLLTPSAGSGCAWRAESGAPDRLEPERLLSVLDALGYGAPITAISSPSQMGEFATSMKRRSSSSRACWAVWPSSLMAP